LNERKFIQRGKHVNNQPPRVSSTFGISQPAPGLNPLCAFSSLRFSVRADQVLLDLRRNDDRHIKKYILVLILVTASSMTSVNFFSVSQPTTCRATTKSQTSHIRLHSKHLCNDLSVSLDILFVGKRKALSSKPYDRNLSTP
jgi:hypothetical protein